MTNEKGKAVASNTADGVISVEGTAKEIVAAFDYCKWQGVVPKGKFHIVPTDRARGLHIRKADLSNGNAAFRIFDTFTNKAKDHLSRPFYDAERNAVISTNGVAMLFCDIPQGLTKEKAEECGFCIDWNRFPCWTSVLNGASRETSPYALAEFTKMGEVEAGSDVHNTLRVAASVSTAYRHTDESNLWRNIYLWIGKNKFDPVSMSLLVDSLFRIGCDRVGFYESRWDYPYNVFHIVGFGSGLNARALLLPIRFPTTETGGIELFPKKQHAAVA